MDAVRGRKLAKIVYSTNCAFVAPATTVSYYRFHTSSDLELYYYCWYCVGHKDPARALKCINAAENIAPNNFRVKRMVGSRERLKKLVDKLQQQEQKNTY